MPLMLSPRARARKRKRRRKRRRKARMRGRARAAATATWSGVRCEWGTWGWVTTRTRSCSLSSAWVCARVHGGTTTLRCGLCWPTAACRNARHAGSAPDPAADPRHTSPSPSWTRPQRGGPSRMSRPWIASAWAKSLSEEEKRNRSPSRKSSSVEPYGFLKSGLQE